MTGRGATPYFVVTAVMFEDHAEALACDKSIAAYRKSLGWHECAEFHFYKMKRELRLEFLARVAAYEFFYFAIVLNKAKLTGPGFRFAGPFNKYAANLVFQNAKPYLTDAIVIFDGKGERRFRLQLQTYLKKRMNEDGRSLIKKVKTEDSHRNNLLQLADVVFGAVARCFNTSKPDTREYRSVIRHREIKWQVWPR